MWGNSLLSLYTLLTPNLMAIVELFLALIFIKIGYWAAIYFLAMFV